MSLRKQLENAIAARLDSRHLVLLEERAERAMVNSESTISLSPSEVLSLVGEIMGIRAADQTVIEPKPQGSRNCGDLRENQAFRRDIAVDDDSRTYFHPDVAITEMVDHHPPSQRDCGPSD